MIGDGLSQPNKSIEIRLLPKKFKETVTNLVFFREALSLKRC